MKAAGAAERAAYFAKMTARGEVVQQVAVGYLRAVADQSEVENAKALVAQAQVFADHAHAAHEAGTAANLDELRAKVQLQAQEQALIAAENQQAKDLILLKREIGVDPEQEVELTDPAPYSELAEQTPEEVRAVAYKNRQDYQNLQNQAVEYQGAARRVSQRAAADAELQQLLRHQHGERRGHARQLCRDGDVELSHLPRGEAARRRGRGEGADGSVNAQLDDLRNHIDEQVRAALLDVSASKQLVDVARSNVDLATRALSDETDRVNAGVDDNLPLVTAQATLATAESNLVESLYQYNVSKLGLARAAGVLEQQYRDVPGAVRPSARSRTIHSEIDHRRLRCNVEAEVHARCLRI